MLSNLLSQPHLLLAQKCEGRALEKINDTADERIVHATHRETDILFFRKFCEFFKLHHPNRYIFSYRLRATVPRRNIKLPESRRLLQLPCKRMLTPAAPHEQYVHFHGRIVHYSFVRISAPFFVMRTVCSKCAVREPSRVR